MTYEPTGPAGDERPETTEDDDEPEVIAHCDPDSEELPWCVGFSV